MLRVQSSNLAAIDFEPHDEPEYEGFGTLTAEFKNGRRYIYLMVPSEVYDKLVKETERTDEGASVGKAFNRYVVARGFEHEEVTEDAG